MRIQPCYTIGIDFGTLSARAVLADVSNGSYVYTSVYEYEDGVLTGVLPGTEVPVPDRFSLQNPENYRNALFTLLERCAKESGVCPDQIIGIGIDFTSCTVLPLDRNLEPLCLDPDYRSNPHSWVKLWKHISPEPEAERLDAAAERRNEEFLSRYSGKTSCEWMFAKLLETYENAPGMYAAADLFLEAGDWTTLLLTGHLCRSSSFASFKGLWDRESGFPSAGYLESVSEGFSSVLDKLRCEQMLDVTASAGTLSKEAAARTGLPEGITVAVPIIDAHAALPALGLCKEGTMMAVIGTSICQMLLSSQFVSVPGVLGAGRNAIIPGLWAYESAQAAGGDSYAWFVESSGSSFRHMNDSLSAGTPGASGLVALDWLNGCRSPYKNSDLSGMLAGLTLKTSPEDIYRALVEATAFGTRRIVEAYTEAGLPVNRIVAGGGIALKSPEVMQVFADVLQKEILVSACTQPAALGCAIYAAAAAGESNGGYADIFSAVSAMSVPADIRYVPNPEYADVYDRLYRVYCRLSETFAEKENSPMKELLKIRQSV